MTAQAPAAGPAGSASTSRRRWSILMVLAGSQMLVQLDATIINTALPAIKRAFELSEGQSLWVADAYMVIFGGLLLLAGALGDRFGRRRILMVGMAVFTLASIGVAFSPRRQLHDRWSRPARPRWRAGDSADAVDPDGSLSSRGTRTRDWHLGGRTRLWHGAWAAGRRRVG